MRSWANFIGSALVFLIDERVAGAEQVSSVA
jgi:hypothetical protein